ncbi:7e59549a-6beb-4047-8fcb-2e89e6e6e9e0 [Thermothielavioides terrestris]|uniref:7e59549a-6beb-4047-8fcb-2e89e6e6e9e0 n=2 Tax=Thermothielavioides terrestris TaxID=2587410 RepID=A0A3S4ATW3_9PEZI|nr:7e59549a-6beb-4047-8fcb-2e89e6e6e9e0 [Thermothielavioides terrestris]
MGINQDLNRTVPAKYEMREIPGKGMGLVATEHIRRGDLILANTASLMIDYRAFNELTEAQYTELQAQAVSSLPSAHRAALLNLSTHSSRDGLADAELVNKIAATNSFDIDPWPDDTDQHHSFFVLFPEIARLNHDCRPNAEYRFEHAALAQHVHAARDIAPGEELTLSYVNPLMTRAQRLQRLERNWGFRCGCPLCALPPARAAESDARIELARKLKQELGAWDAGSRATPEMAELLVSLYETERLWGSMHEAYTLAALEFSAAGDAWTAVKYARLGIEWGIPMVGEHDEDLAELRSLAEDPWAHWSWRRRVERDG